MFKICINIAVLGFDAAGYPQHLLVRDNARCRLPFDIGGNGGADCSQPDVDKFCPLQNCERNQKDREQIRWVWSSRPRTYLGQSSHLQHSYRLLNQSVCLRNQHHSLLATRWSGSSRSPPCWSCWVYLLLVSQSPSPPLLILSLPFTPSLVHRHRAHHLYVHILHLYIYFPHKTYLTV